MREMAACGCGGAGWGCGGAHRFEWPAVGVAARVVDLIRGTAGRTVRRCFGGSSLLAESGSQIGFLAHVPGLHSRTSAKFGRRARSIDEKVIGRSMRRLASRVGRRSPLISCRGWRIFRPLGGAMPGFALLHQPARQHGCGVFFQPGIEQLRDLLAEIGGVTEPRKLITLQRVPGRREKELPRWLGSVIQGDLQGKPRHSINKITIVNSIEIRTYCGKLCKSLPAHREPSGFVRSRVKAL
jgi:hypothetical protein